MKRKCLKGWILTPSPTDGESVPFFVQVRSKDIHWTPANLPSTYLNLYNVSDTKKHTIRTDVWTFTTNNWNIELYNDLGVRANYKLNIKSMTRQSANKLSAYVSLPLVMDTSTITVQCTVQAHGDCEASAIVSYELMSNGLNVTLTNYNVPFDESNANVSSNSAVDIAIQGTAL